MLFKVKPSVCALTITCIVWYGCVSPKEEKLPKFFGDYTNITKYSEDSVPTKDIKFIESQTYGNTEKVFYKRINIIALDEYDRVYLENNSTIHQYDSTGKYIQSIGQKGRGPGEFQVIHNVKIINNRLYVYDANLQRVSIYNLNLNVFENEIDIPPIKGLIGLGEFAVQADGSLVLGLIESKTLSNNSITEKYMHYFILDSSGQINTPDFITTKLSGYFEVTNNNGTSYPPIPFDRTTLFSISPSDKMYFLWTENISIKILNSDGSLHNGIYYSFHNDKVSDNSDFPAVYESLNIISDTKRILGTRLPDTHPAIAHFFIDNEERMWFSTIIPDRELYEWWVLENSGELITKFLWPRNKSIKLVNNNYAYVVEADEEGEVFLVKYKIEFKERE